MKNNLLFLMLFSLVTVFTLKPAACAKGPGDALSVPYENLSPGCPEGDWQAHAPRKLFQLRADLRHSRRGPVPGLVCTFPDSHSADSLFPVGGLVVTEKQMLQRDGRDGSPDSLSEVRDGPVSAGESVLCLSDSKFAAAKKGLRRSPLRRSPLAHYGLNKLLGQMEDLDLKPNASVSEDSPMDM